MLSLENIAQSTMCFTCGKESIYNTQMASPRCQHQRGKPVLTTIVVHGALSCTKRKCSKEYVRCTKTLFISRPLYFFSIYECARAVQSVLLRESTSTPAQNCSNVGSASIPDTEPIGGNDPRKYSWICTSFNLLKCASFPTFLQQHFYQIQTIFSSCTWQNFLIQAACLIRFSTCSQSTMFLQFPGLRRKWWGDRRNSVGRFREGNGSICDIKLYNLAYLTCVILQGSHNGTWGELRPN